MKKNRLFLCLLLCLALCACGEPAGPSPSVSPSGAAEPSQPDEAAVQPYNAQSLTTLLDAGIFSEAPEELDDDIACELMGVDPALVEDCQVYLPTSTNAEALALFVLNSAGDAETVKTACESWVADQIESYQDYAPTHVPKLEGAVLSVRENTVLLVVGNDPAAAKSAVDALA